MGNLMIRWKAARTDHGEAAATFAAEQAATLSLLSRCGGDDLAQPVLIRRLRGIEDSSRYWSLLMVVDHLRIVNREISTVIDCLGAGRLPAREASIAGVKPSPQVTEAVIPEFTEGCLHFARRVAALPDLKTTLKFPHPWFGPMDAATWHFMAGFHMRLHRKQMELIIAGLARKQDE